jgi:hypothetical protein
MWKQADTQWKKFGSSPIGEEAEVADVHETAWQQKSNEARGGNPLPHNYCA